MIRALQHLAGAEAVCFRLISLDISNGAWFKAPCVVNQQFCIDAEHFVEQVFVIIILWFPE